MLKRTCIWSCLALVAMTTSARAQVVYGVSRTDLNIYEINLATGLTSSSQSITMPGFTVTRALGLSADPTDSQLYGIFQVSSGDRHLGSINPATGVATNLGNLGDAFSSLAFRADGTLWGVVGDGGTASETLFTINKATAATTLQFALGNGFDGEVIAFHANGLLYHSSGNGTALFESVNVDTQVVTPIGSASPEMFAMGYVPTTGLLYGSDIAEGFFSIDIATGARTSIGLMNVFDNRGIAFVAPVPEPTSMALVGVAGAFIALRARRKRAIVNS